MNRPIEPDRWDDDRLATAFAALAATRTLPTDASVRVVESIRASARDQTALRWHRSAPLFATASLVVIGIVGLAVAGPLRMGVQVPDTTRQPSAGRSDAPTLSDLPVSTVSDLVEREAGPVPAEVAVHAWIARAPDDRFCPIDLAPHPLVPHCTERSLFLMDTAEDLTDQDEPAGPHVTPMLRVDAHVSVEVPFGRPIEVIAIGHQDDHRAGDCPPPSQRACRARFVIDRLVAAGTDVEPPPTPWTSDAAPLREPAQVLASLRLAVGDITLVSIGVIAEDRLSDIEPAIGGTRLEARGVWVVRALVRDGPDPGVGRTFLLPDARRLADGSDFVSEVTATGVVVLSPPPLPSASPPSAPPTAVLGLPVVSVADAIAIRDDGTDDRELAVRGWYTPVPPIPCPYTPATSPVQPVCPDDWVILMQDPESIVTRLENGFEGRAPVGPSFHIDLDDLDTSWAPPPSSVVGPSSPIEIVVVGHFDDRRSFACPAAEVDACRDRFIVDRVDWVAGRSVPTSALDLVDGGAASTTAEIEATLLGTVPGAEILSMTADSGEYGLPRMEPSIGVFAQLQDQRAIWVVRLLDRCVGRCTARGVGELGTYLVVDGTDALFRIDADNVSTQVAGTLPVPSPVPREMLGLEVMDVDAALTIQARPSDDREIAVAGWFQPDRSVADCLVPRRQPSPLYTNCQAYGHLAAKREALGVGVPRMPIVIYPSSWSVHLDPIRPVVVVGHFDDRRSSACAGAPGEMCADVFWVDAVWANGAPADTDWNTSTSDEPAPIGTHDGAWSVASHGSERALIRLSVGRITSTDLRTLEPVLDLQIKPLRGDALVQESWVWHVTGLEPETGRVLTFVVPDSAFASSGGASTYEIDGQQVTIRTVIVD